MTRVTTRLRLQTYVVPIAALGALWAAATNAASQTPPTAASLAPYFAPITAGVANPDADGFIRRWLLLEPIVKPNRSNTVFTGTYVRDALTTTYFPGQLTDVPRAGDKAKAAQPLEWHALDSKLFDIKLFNFAQAFHKPVYGVIFWAVTVVDSPREMKDVRLAVGSNSASMWWVNGKEAVGLFGDRRMVMDDGVSNRISLRKGRNVIRGAVINGPGLSDFCVRFIDADGHAVTDLSIDVK
jgi:hypothetical protein